MAQHSILDDFHPVVREWFLRAYGAPTPPQELGWPHIAAGHNTLILAPTGSGKTLASFLWAINHLVDQSSREPLDPGIRVLYISPLKALNNDIERNLRLPLAGIHEVARHRGVAIPELRAAVRTGDTPTSERAAMLRKPPDILITTPESLYLMLTSARQRGLFTSVQYVIVDEIHSICGNKRGVHLSLSLERLQAIADQEFVRIGLSATQRPLETVAAFLGGLTRSDNGEFFPRPVDIVDAGRRKSMDVRVVCPVPDFSMLPEEGAWPVIFESLYDEIRRHTTTLVFVNNRRLAERIASKLNLIASGVEDGASSGAVNLSAVPVQSAGTSPPTASPETVFAQAYHGSMSREARESMEAALKSGKLHVLVATSSLELGIDIGSIDLVIQVESPKGIARGLQRIGRSGHLVHATSKGRIYPTHREDLVEASVVSKAILAHDVEPARIPENCLDVLAQQIVAMVAVDEWNADDLFLLLRGSYCYRNLSRKLFDSVVSMLAGRFSDDALGDLRARISWDPVNNMLRPLPGTSHLAITSGGTIADRGYYGVYLEDAKTKVGEVDEEFIYESRPGDRFILGSTVWAMKSIDANRVIVAPAPGQPARMPFWKGEGIGRSYDLGEQLGAFRRIVAEKIDDPEALRWLASEYPLDANAAWNILEYFRRQQATTGSIPDDRTIIVEHTRDELGDPRVIVHSSYGRRINGLLGLLLEHRIKERCGVNPDMIYNDDGVLLRLQAERDFPGDVFSADSLANAREIVLEELYTSPLFAGQFRQNAARALLLPKPGRGKRTPLWVQRIRAGDLLQLLQTHEDFPIVLETIRDVLNDVLDLPHFLALVEKIRIGAVRVSHVSTEVPSPFAAGLLFAFLGMSMYAGDAAPQESAPPAHGAQSQLLDDLLAQNPIGTFLRPDAIAAVEARLQHEAAGTQARSAEELMQVMLRVGDLEEEEIRARTSGSGLEFVRSLEEEKRVLRIRIGEREKWVPAEYAEMYRAPDDAGHAEQIVRRYLQGHGPVRPSVFVRRYGFREEWLTNMRDRIVDGRQILRGNFAGGDEEEWCLRANVDQIRRQTISVLRKEVAPVPLRQFTLFLQRWTGFLPSGSSHDILSLLDQFQGLPLPIECWDRDILRPRTPPSESGSLHSLTRDGTIVWIGLSSGRAMPVFRGSGSEFVFGAAEGEPMSPGAMRLFDYVRQKGASFFSDIRSGTGLSLEAMNNSLAELFWNGVISNDTLDELLTLKRSIRETDRPIEPILLVDPKHNPARGRILGRARKSLRQVPGWSGRWFPTQDEAVEGEPMTQEQRAFAQARRLLLRYGVFAREFLGREVALTWSELWPAFQMMELRGEIRRGYFVTGLSGMQYALPEAAEELRSATAGQGMKDSRRVILMPTCDPANVYGPGIDLERGPGQDPVRCSRLPGNYIAFADGGPILLIEGGGSSIITIGAPAASLIEEAMREFVGMLKLPENARPFKEIVIEYWNGARPAAVDESAMLRRLGFQRDRNQTVRVDAYSL